ncbi:hypothetical protein [Paraburkholderia diazotrophica]|uniref:hypothetical protein n=1 Tax=Paraburkholderia diazotrophica TaxID=667676 RepID=UPI0031788EE4
MKILERQETEICHRGVMQGYGIAITASRLMMQTLRGHTGIRFYCSRAPVIYT